MVQREGEHLIEWQEVGGVTVVHFKTAHLRDERLIRGIFERLEELAEGGRSNLVLNFSGLEAFASYAIGKLIRLDERLRPPAGRLALCELTPTVREIIDIMNLHKRFQIYATEQEALESFV